MQITDLKAILLSCPVPKPYRHISDFGTMVQQNCILVEISTDEDITGYGEAYDYGAPIVIKTIIENQLKPILIGENPTYIGKLWNKMYQGLRTKIADEQGRIIPLPIQRKGQTLCAISGVEIALWDIVGKSLKKPVYKILGEGGFKEKMKAYASKGGWMTPKEIAQEARKYRDQGFRAYKMSWGMGPSIDVKRLKAVREAVGDDFDIMLDCHGTQNSYNIIKMAKIFEKYNVAWIEEPISYDDIDELVAIKRKINTPIAGGESEVTRFGVKDLIQKRAVDIIQPDALNTGGLAEARKIAIIASVWNILCAPHVWCCGIGIAASLHFACSIQNSFIFEFPTAYNPLRNGILLEPIDPLKGYIKVPRKLGLGIEFDESAIKKFPYRDRPTRI